MSDELSGTVIDVLSSDSMAAEVCFSETNSDEALLVIHSGADKIIFHGLPIAHARLMQMAVNSPYYEDVS